MAADLAGRQALVTGAGSGIGRAIALALAGEGMRVHLVGRDAQKLARVVSLAPERASFVAADLSASQSFAEILEPLGPELHVLVHSAGSYARGPVALMNTQEWAALDSINVHAPVALTAACLPRLRAASGHVVFVNSSAGLHATAGVGAYSAGKHALKAAVDVLRQELSPDRIRVLSIYPGRTDTPMQQAILRAEGRSAGPGSLMPPEDVAAMVLAALRLSESAEVTDIVLRPARPI